MEEETGGKDKVWSRFEKKAKSKQRY